MGNQPVYRRPRSHAYSCRCPRCVASMPAKGSYGIAGPVLIIVAVVAVIGFWPAMVWHGYTDTGGWRWDIHSTVAELVYFGTIGFVALMCWLGNRPARPPFQAPPTMPPAPPLPRPRQVRMPSSACQHLHAVKVENLLDPDAPPWAYLCPDPPRGCGARLGLGVGRLMRPCCGTPPGDPHWGNCPHREE